MIAQSQSHASALAENICSDYKLLNNTMVRHEPLIRKRWSKKSVAQRSEILRAACPTIAMEHQPDFAWRHQNMLFEEGAGPKPKEHVDVMLWPFINLEDLTKPKSLLIYLNSRARNLPWTFATGEVAFSQYGVLCSSCKPREMLATVHFMPNNDPTVYGQVRRVHGCCGQVDGEMIHCDLIQGLQMLKMQQRIMRFLVSCCRYILHDMTEEEMLSGPVLEEPPVSEILLPVDGSHVNLADTIAIAPYIKRGDLELARLRGYVNAMYSEAKDHVLSLREDPSYLADTIIDNSEHSRELIPDACGRIDQSVDTPEFLMGVTGHIISQSYQRLIMWSEVSARLDQLCLHAQNGTATQNQLQSVLDLEALLERARSCLLGDVTSTSMASPTMRNYYERIVSGSGDGPYTQIAIAGGDTLPTEGEAWMLSVFHRLLAFSQNDSRKNINGFAEMSGGEKLNVDIDLHATLDRLDTLSRKHQSARAMLTAPLSSLISQLSIVEECLHQIELWKKSSEIWMLLCTSGMKATESNKGAFSINWAYYIYAYNVPVYLVNPARGKLRYPIDKPRNAQSVKTMRDSESNLDKFWSCIDSFYERRTGVAQDEVVRRCLLEGGEMRRTAPWTGPSVPTECFKSIEYKAISNYDHDVALQITGTFDKPVTRGSAKRKKRYHAPVGITPMTQVHEIGHPSPEKKPERIYCVDKRAHKVFKTLFHVPLSDLGETPKAIKWDDFKRAMIRAGFSAEKLQGSAWQFTPSVSTDVARGIQFHEPHPDSSIPYIMARRFGRRLQRVYGWHGGVFKLA
ncbi:uncharacterized protein J4E87_005338 [Alternaria ethzedia]|uniref:uncharacterized protein n=1 Tax=Alternaria ethzedia TaxID=181014 RepID=UPI0020C4521F|nr:uncharacterized protein J4E87_005338 [Alternaria ethzedia]KAI4624857.1 hypothetical protein J4E87_005338 [Alternaria ethzedia]